MPHKKIQWINTPVINEAIFRYEKGLLNRSMRLWIEKLLELDTKKIQQQFETSDPYWNR